MATKRPAPGPTAAQRAAAKARAKAKPEHACVALARSAFAGKRGITAVKMFGGIGFMLDGKLAVAASRRGLLVRTGAAARDEALTRPGARPMTMRGKWLADYVRVGPEAVNAKSIDGWVALAVAFTKTLPVKKQR